MPFSKIGVAPGRHAIQSESLGPLQISHIWSHEPHDGL
jgi:hypothetical protein